MFMHPSEPLHYLGYTAATLAVTMQMVHDKKEKGERKNNSSEPEIKGVIIN